MSKNTAVKPGTLYLDLTTKELYFDDPSGTTNTHQKVIDASTLLYTTSTSPTWPTSNVVKGLLKTRDNKTFAPLTLIGNIYNADGTLFDAITKAEVNTELGERDTRLTTLESDVDALEGRYVNLDNSNNLGGTNKHIYISGNKFVASNANVGNNTNFMYLSSGTMTASNANVGGEKQIMYLKAGTFTASTTTLGSTGAPVYLDSGVLTEVTTVNTAHGGTGAVAHTANRLVWSTGSSKLEAADNHFVDATHIGVNYTGTTPSYNLYVNGSTGLSGGHLYLTGANESSSTSNTTQLVFGSANNVHLAVSSNTKALVLNPGLSATTNQIVLYLDQKSLFPSGLSTGGGLLVTSGASQFSGTVKMEQPLTFENSTATKQQITTSTGAMYYSSASTVYVTSGSGSSIIFQPQGTEQARFNTSGKLELKSGGNAKATINGPSTAGTFYFPNTGGTFVTHATRGTAVGSTNVPVYIADTGRATEVTYIGVGAGGTGVISHTANRLVWSTSAAAIQGGYHYANTTKIGVNLTSEPAENFYVNGTAKVSGNTAINGSVTIGNGCTLAYDSTQKSLKFIFI